MRRYWIAGWLLLAYGCAAARAKPLAPLVVTQVVTGHHGHCGKAAKRIFGERAARFFSVPIPYEAFHCMSFTEAQLLMGGCGDDEGVVFITLSRPQVLHFSNASAAWVAHVQTFGEKWEKQPPRAILYLPMSGIPKVSLRAGTHIRRYAGPPLYGLFGVSGDPLGIAGGECPTDPS